MLTKRSITFSLFALLLGGAFCVPLPSLPSSQQSVVVRAKPKAAVKPVPKSAKAGLKPLSEKQKFVVLFAYVCAIYYGESGSNCLDPNIYRVRFTRVMLKSFKDHPTNLGDPIPCGMIRGRRVCSDASGAGQWMSFTWEPAVAYCKTVGLYSDKLEKFSPENQNNVMACYLNKLGALKRLYRGAGVDGQGRIYIDPQGFDESVYHLCRIWVSLPCHANDTDGGADQGANRIEKVRQVFWDYIPKFTKALS